MTGVRTALGVGLGLLAAAVAPAQPGAPAMLRDIGQPPHYYAPSFFVPGVQFIPLGNALYTAGWDGAEGSELWRTNGTPEGTAPVVDACPGDCTGMFPLELAASDGMLIPLRPIRGPQYNLRRIEGSPTAPFPPHLMRKRSGRE